MATADKVFIREDYFYCSICLEIYNTPRTLPCLHTFCHSCLAGYIYKISDKHEKRKLFCPICRSDTNTDNVQFKRVEKWVESFPINFTLLSILNERKSRMNQKENNCTPCLREETKVNAIVYCCDCSEKLCEECKRHHKKSKLSSNHQLIDIKDGSVDKLDVTELEYFTNLSKCPKHCSEEVIDKYICKDHDQLCCNECAIVIHRQCEDLVSLADEVNRHQEENGESKIQKRLELVGDHTDKLIEQETKFISDLNTKETEVKNCLKNFKANVDDAYNKLEKRILSEMSARKLALTKSSSSQKNCAEKLKDDIKQSAEKLKKATELGTATHMFLLNREMGKVIKECEEAFQGLHQNSSKTSLTITETSPVQEVVKVISDNFKIEETETESSPPFLARGRDFKERNMALINEFNLQMNAQPRYCLWMENCIVVAFLSRTEIHAYNSGDGSLLSSYQCSSSPSDLATIENDQFAVSLPASNKIDVMKIHKNQISCDRLLVNSQSDLVTYNRRDKQLLTMSRSEGVIRKFTVDGKEAGTISLNAIERNIVGEVYNIFFDNEYNRVYISSHNQCKLLCIDKCGKLVFQYGIRYPWSVITDSEGNAYITSYNGHCIQQISPDGRLLRDIISTDDNVRQPMAMSFNNQMNRIVITCNSWEKGMRIYQFK